MLLLEGTDRPAINVETSSLTICSSVRTFSDQLSKVDATAATATRKGEFAHLEASWDKFMDDAVNGEPEDDDNDEDDDDDEEEEEEE